jgi:hypothetical protein
MQQSPDNFFWSWHVAGCLYHLYGILMQLGDPNSLLFSRRLDVGSPTGTFVNRKKAATFWRSSALLLLVPLELNVSCELEQSAAGAVASLWDHGRAGDPSLVGAKFAWHIKPLTCHILHRTKI